ncbi:MAG: prepilin-type N-terminal cleavage/methylation domain-containing protein [Lachnospiraceae bacterium]|nr:prepilin-type N-terminal cleavage/methylation domain-containing protein [Lachnospiraceae bacterium]
MNTKVAKKQNNKGFTLIELIVVIAIIAVLAAILAPQYLRYVEKSRVASDQQYAGELRNAIKTSLSEEAAAQAVSNNQTVIWSSSGLSGTAGVTASANTKVTSTSLGSNDFAKELATNLSGETISVPKSKTYSSQKYTITINVSTDAISVSGSWGN